MTVFAGRSTVARPADLMTPADAPGAIPPPPLGVLIYDDALNIDSLLVQCAQALAQLGFRLGGVVQSNPPRPGRRKCDMLLNDLSSGETTLISSDQGDGANGCRLDLSALSDAALGVEKAVAAGVDLVIINKFGKQEAQGRGFRSAIAEALVRDIPVVLAVSRLNLDACLEFAGGRFTQLEAEPVAIVDWCRQAVGRSQRDGGDRHAAV